MYYGYDNNGYGAGVYANKLDHFGTLRLATTSPEQTWLEPLTLSEAKDNLQIIDGPIAYTAQDNTIRDMIVEARQVAEYFQQRDLVPRTWELTYDYWPSLRIELRDPLIAVLSVQYENADGVVTVLTPGTDYRVDSHKSTPIITPPSFKTWPTFYPDPSSAITITFTSGYSNGSSWWRDQGSLVRRGMKSLIKHWFQNGIPYSKGIGTIDQFPWTVTEPLESGARMRAK